MDIPAATESLSTALAYLHPYLPPKSIHRSFWSTNKGCQSKSKTRNVMTKPADAASAPEAQVAVDVLHRCTFLLARRGVAFVVDSLLGVAQAATAKDGIPGHIVAVMRGMATAAATG